METESRSYPPTRLSARSGGKQGQAQVVAIIKQMHLKEAMDDLKQHDDYTNKVLVPKFGKILPGTR